MQIPNSHAAAPQYGAAVFPFRHVSVTGGTGVLGSQFIKVLLNQFPDVRTVNTPCRPGSPRAGRIPTGPRVNVVSGGLEDMGVLTKLVDGGEVVFHLAAWLANTEMPAPTSVFITNGLAAGVLARLCARRGKRMVFTSSHSVYFAGRYEGTIREDDFAFREDFVKWIEAVREPYGELIATLMAGKSDFSAAPQAIDAIHRRLPPPWNPKIYDRDAYHIYCLTKLLAERLVMDQGAVVLRLANTYGPGDDSTQAVAEACQRILAADPAVQTKVNQPFKKLVPAYLGDIIKSMIRAAMLPPRPDLRPLFTIASQEHYLREDALLRTVASALNGIRGTRLRYEIETLAGEPGDVFRYDLGKMDRWVLPRSELMTFEEGVAEQLLWLLERAEGRPARAADVTIHLPAGR